MNPTTGVGSTSFTVWITGVIASILAVVLPMITHQPASLTMTTTIAGGVVLVVVSAVKLWHDIEHRKIVALAGDVQATAQEALAVAREARSLVVVPAPTGGSAAATAPPAGAVPPAAA